MHSRARVTRVQLRRAEQWAVCYPLPTRSALPGGPFACPFVILEMRFAEPALQAM